ncbi:MAG: ABC transporter ATP-binding protein [Pseudomonadota bacterium]
MTSRLCTKDLTLSYGRKTVLDGITLEIPDAQITAIVGPNACGKSTLLRCLARLMKPKKGKVLLDGKPIHRVNTKAVAQTISLLPQSAETPPGMRVVDLVARGRTPHQSPLQQWSKADQESVDSALTRVGLSDQANALLSEISGGQRQRAWIAMVLAQDTEILLLDEPTTFLDLNYQIETLKLVQDLQEQKHLTVVMVLHDINLAARFAANIIALREGGIVVQGAPETVVTEANIKAIYDLSAKVVASPVTQAPYVIAL